MSFNEECESVVEGAAELTAFDRLRQAATVETNVVDPKVGKHDGATVSEVKVVEGAEYLAFDIHWAGMVDGDGFPFTHSQRVFVPSQESLFFAKQQFQQLLKGLGLVPATSKEYFTFSDREGLETVVAAMQGVVGQSFNITIGQDNRGYYRVTVRR